MTKWMLASALSVLLPVVAAAQVEGEEEGEGAAGATGGAAATTSKMRVGGQVDLLPVGTMAFEAGGFSGSESTAVAFGIGGFFAYDVTPMISVGIAPRFLFNVIPKDADSGDDPAKELDIRLRIEIGKDVAPKVRAFGFLTPGFSMVLLPSEATVDNDPSGLILGFGAGATYDITPAAFLVGELGYQLGFQGGEDGGTEYDFTTDYLHLGFGAGVRI